MPEPPRAAPPPPMEPLPVPVPRPGEGLAPAAVKNVLLANCGYCHGPTAPAAASGGFRFIDDLDQLVDAGLIVPLSSATSPIVIRMRDGSMPPAGPGSPVTKADLELVAFYIDNPRYWPRASEPAAFDAGTETPAFDAGVDGG